MVSRSDISLNSKLFIFLSWILSLNFEVSSENKRYLRTKFFRILTHTDVLLLVFLSYNNFVFIIKLLF